MIACAFTGNTASNGFGGGIWNGAGDANISTSTFSNNLALQSGAIEHTGSNLRVTQSTFVSNKSFGSGYNGGAVSLGSPAAITNCTFSGNSSRGFGGAIWVNLYSSGFTAEVSSVTITLNTADTPGGGGTFGGGIRVDAGTALKIRNSIIASNLLGSASSSGTDLSGSLFVSDGYNLVGKTNGAVWIATTGDKLGSAASPTNAMLGPLQNNGGATWTHAPLAGSPAIDQGKSFGLTTDQRGRPRPFDFASITNAAGGDGSDIGAFEPQLSSPPVLSIARSANNVVLSWSTNDADYTLESTPVFLNTSNMWTTVGTPGIVGDQYTVTNDTASSNKFYRLKGP